MHNPHLRPAPSHLAHLLTQRKPLLATSFLLLAAAQLPAQQAPDVAKDTLNPDEARKEEFSNDVLKLDDFVVTAVAAPGTVSKMQSSVSVSTLPMEQIQISVPRNTSEIFRSLPAIRSEATAGDANSNMTARGLPLSTGGSQYVQIQEDGAPILQFGDIAFATADTFLRADSTLGSIEAVRGGSASTYATSAPGGVINLISKTGEVTGGSVALTRGIDFDTNRLDFEYGSPINESLRFHVGGFYRTGEGSRKTGFSGYNGGQVKLNVTRQFEGGYVRFYFKALKDQGPTYMPMPVKVAGSESNPTYESLPGYDFLRDTQYTPALTRDVRIGGSGSITSTDITDGVVANSVSIGGEFNFNLPGGWNLVDRANFSANNGQFVAPFPAEVTEAQALADAIGGAGATLWYASGARAGQQIANPAALNGNGLLSRVHIFNTKLNRMDLFSNNLKLNKSFTLDNASKLNVGLGYYISKQYIDQDWNWNSYLQDVKRDADLIDVRSAPASGDPASSGQLVTEHGLIAYGVPAWGWFARKYDLKYDISSPNLNLGYTSQKLSVDASVRRDGGKARGAKYDATTTRQVVDMNGDGVISYPESLGAQRIDLTKPAPMVNYDFHHLSYSGGVNYQFTKAVAVFGRYSKGAAIRADRLLDAGNVQADGSIPDNDVAFNTTKQAELGVKYRPKNLVPGNLAFFVTAFQAKTNEANSEAAKGGAPLILRNYDAKGLELESAYTINHFDLRASLTYTDAEIVGANDPTVIGHTPRRQAKWIYSISPSYTYRKLNVGLSLIGTSKAYTQDNNQLVMPGFAYVNASAGYELSKGLWISLSVNNAFNATGVSEAEEGSLPANRIVRARSIPGRTTSVQLKYLF
ncbi:TonB-dependent receptor [Opitutaceae bacterium EW11]|nr:TonB-dependent receptor [Opitutaceae bacterium EW11]